MSKHIFFRSVFAIAMAISLSGCYNETSAPSHSRTVSTPAPPPQPVPQKKNETGKLVTVQRGRFYRKKSPFGSKEEVDVFHALLGLQKKVAFRIFSQVSMGVYVGSEETEAYNAIRALRPDFLITSTNYKPLGVVEYNGHEHYAENDKVKQEVLQKIGMFYHVVKSEHNSNKDALYRHLEKDLLPKIRG